MTGVEPRLDELAARLAPQGITGLRRLAGGASSLTYRATREEAPVVVKVAPAGLEPVRHRDVLRQARPVRALQDTPVPVPAVLWEDPGEPPEIPPLFVMSFVEGESTEPLFDVQEGGADAATMGERLTAASRTMAMLHRLRPHALELGPEEATGPEAEIERWARLLATVDADLVPGWEPVRDRLAASVPPPAPPAVVHGDFRLGNLLAVGARITAVIDWEIWSIGDPRIDLGWFLLNADPESYGRSTPYAHRLPSPGELLATYTDAVGRPVPDVEWFEALAAFKSTATWALIVKHDRRRATSDPIVAGIPEVLPRLLARAGRLLS